MIKPISTSNAPGAIGPYSQATQIGNFVFTSGQLGLHPETGQLGETIGEQAKQSLDNLKAVLEAAGTNMSQVIKTTVFVKDLNDFAQINEIYATYFTEPYPARSTVEVARLPKDGLVEIEAVANII